MRNTSSFARARKRRRNVLLLLVILAVQFLGLLNFGSNSFLLSDARADGFTISSPSGTGTVGQVFSGYTVTGTGPGMLAYIIDDPTIGGSGLTFNIISGVIEGTPTAPLATTTFTITEMSDTGPANQTYDLTISAAPAGLSITAPLSNATLNGQVGVAYSSSVTSTGGVAPVTYAVTSGTLPNGLSLASGGAITGTPTAAGTFTVSITATDSDAPASTSTVTSVDFVIAPATLAITAPLSNATLNGQVGVAYSSSVTSSGGVAPVTYAVTSGTLPLGLSLASGGAITGTPSTAGTFTVSITATDSDAPASTSTVTSVDFVIAPAALAITAPLSNATLNGQVGVAYSSTVTSSGGVAPVTYAVTSGSLPNGLSLASGGAITGTPTANGTFTVSITATDSDAPASTSTVTSVDFVIAPAGLAITAPLSNATINGQVGTAYSSSVTSSGGVAPVTYAVTSGTLPDGLSLASGGGITGTPTTAGTFTVSIIATDSDAPASTSTVTGVDFVIAPGPLTITAPLSNATINGQVGTPYSSNVTSSGGVALVTYTVTNGSLPNGLTLSLGGAISGTPTTPGTFTVSIAATDSDVPPNTSTVTHVDFVIAPAPLAITAPLSNHIFGGQVGTIFSTTINSTGGIAPVTYAVTSGSLPNGLSLAPGGAITGTPTVAATFTVAITATDSDVPASTALVTNIQFVIAAASPPATIPDPPQTSSIITYVPKSGPPTGGNAVDIVGNFLSDISAVEVDGVRLDKSSWDLVSRTMVRIIMPEHSVGSVQIQLYNGQTPLLESLGYSYVITPVASASASPTSSPSASASPTSSPSPSASPTSSPSASASPTSSPSASASPTSSPSASASPTSSPSASASPTSSPSERSARNEVWTYSPAISQLPGVARIILLGLFPNTITAITVDGQSLSSGSWNQTSRSLDLYMPVRNVVDGIARANGVEVVLTAAREADVTHVAVSYSIRLLTNKDSSSISPSPTASASPSVAPSVSASASGSPSPSPSKSYQAVTTKLRSNSNFATFNLPVKKFCLSFTTDISLASRAPSSKVNVQASCVGAATKLNASLLSDPIIIGEGVADSAGIASFEAVLPENIPAGIHKIVVTGTSVNSQPLQVVAAFEIDDKGKVLAYSPPAQVSQPVDSLLPTIKRALAIGKPMYDPKEHPGTTTAIAITAVTFLGVAGARKITRLPQPVEAELSEIKTDALKRVKQERSGRGDLSRTWRFPGTTKADQWISNLTVRSGSISAMLPRVLVDGSWARAMFGAGGFTLWGIGLLVGMISSAQVGFLALPPTSGLILLIVALGILDATAGAIAWTAIATLALVTGHLTTWADVRTLLGMFVLFSSIPLLAHALRPLRRPLDGTTKSRFDRFADYVMPPILLAMAATTMFNALNGLSGLELATSSQLKALAITVAVVFLVRILLEDLALIWYPQRSRTCQPGRPLEQLQFNVWASFVLKLLVFLLVAAPFFGLGSSTFIALGLTAIMLLLNIFEDALPNSVRLYRWFPRGIANFFITLVLAIYVGSWILGSDPTAQRTIDRYPLILLPGIIFAILELFGRDGDERPDDWPKRAIEIFVWLATVGIILGAISL